MKKTLYVILAASIVLTSCSKSGSDAPASPDPYMNTKAGSTWTYELTDNSNAPAPPTVNLYTVTSTNRDSTVNGKSYHVYTTTSGGSNEYYNISGNAYYNFRALPAQLGGASKEVLYLKDNVIAGGPSWEATRVDVPTPLGNITVIFTNTITARGLSKTVNSVTYNDVIQVTTTLSTLPALPPGSFTADIQAFYAPRYGMIQSINKISTSLTTPAISIDQTNILKSSVLVN